MSYLKFFSKIFDSKDFQILLEFEKMKPISKSYEDVCNEIVSLLDSLRPFSIGKTKAFELNNKNFKELLLGNSISLKTKYLENILNLKKDPIFGLEILRNEGDRIIEFLRPNISQYFAETLKLIKNLIFEPKEIKEEIRDPGVEIFFPYDLVDLQVEKITISKIEISSAYFNNINLFPEERDQIYLNTKKLFLYIQIPDILSGPVQRIISEVEKIQNHNSEIVRQIREVLMPFIISRSLKFGG